LKKELPGASWFLRLGNVHIYDSSPEPRPKELIVLDFDPPSSAFSPHFLPPSVPLGTSPVLPKSTKVTALPGDLPPRLFPRYAIRFPKGRAMQKCPNFPSGSIGKLQSTCHWLHLAEIQNEGYIRTSITERSHASRFKRSKPYRNIFDLPKSDDI
jgi:hypothetical protein